MTTKPKKTEDKEREVVKQTKSQEISIVDIWRRCGRSSARNETDALLEEIVNKIGLK